MNIRGAVQAIREEYAHGLTYAEIGKIYAVSYESIRQIIDIEHHQSIRRRHFKARQYERGKRCAQCGKFFIPRAHQKFHNNHCALRARRMPIGGQLNPFSKKTSPKKYYHWRYTMLKKYRPELMKQYQQNKWFAKLKKQNAK